METPVVIKRSKRKTVSLSVTRALEILVRAPFQLPEERLYAFVQQHQDWIEKQLAAQQQRNLQAQQHCYAPQEIKELKTAAAQMLGQRVEHYSRLMGVVPTGLKITSAATRWGSCSGRNSLCFSYRTALLPPDLVDYIVVHELAHIRVKDHSHRFYREVERYLPDYKQRIAQLREAGRAMGL